MKTIDLSELVSMRGPAVEARIDSLYQELRQSLPLATMRSDCAITQTEIAQRLGVSQAAVSKIESRADILMSTLFRYAAALGGSVRVSVNVAGVDYAIRAADAKASSFVLKKKKPKQVARIFSIGSSHKGKQSSTEANLFWERSARSVADVVVSRNIFSVANDHCDPNMEVLPIAEAA